jgi:hypothetical protein
MSQALQETSHFYAENPQEMVGELSFNSLSERYINSLKKSQWFQARYREVKNGFKRN